MREEIEAAALFITKLVNKNLSQYGSSATQCGSSASSIHSSASSTSSTSESPPGFDVDQTTQSSIGSDQDTQSSTTTTNKVEQFRQCLTNALYERFHNHWFPDQPTKGQAYRCIRLNEWDRHDSTLQKACLQCGIDYKDLQLPVELTLWVDPDEVTCRFGENKGSHCLVAKFKDGELKDNNFNIDDINSIDIEIFQQATNNSRQQSLLGSPDYHKQQQQQQHNQHNNHNNGYHFLHQNNNNNSHHNNNNNNSSSNNNHHHHHHHQQTQPPIHHRSNIGKSAIFPSYHQNYLNGCDNNGNPIYYYF